MLALRSVLLRLLRKGIIIAWCGRAGLGVSESAPPTDKLHNKASFDPSNLNPGIRQCHHTGSSRKIDNERWRE